MNIFLMLFLSVTSYFQIALPLKPLIFHGIKSFPHVDGSDAYYAIPVLNPIVPPVFVLFVLAP